MNKTLAGLILASTVAIGSTTYTIKLNEDNKILESTIKEKETEIVNLNKELNDLQVDTKELLNDINALNKVNGVLRGEVESLENKMKEVLPTSIGDLHFNPNNLNEKSNANVARLNEMLKGTGLQGLGSSYKKAEEEYGVNAIFLISLTAEESAWGKSRRAREDNNISGFEVYNDSAKGARFNSKHESIMTTGKLLGNLYLNTNGKYYKGNDIYSVNKTYCPVNGYSWSNNIIKIANKLMEG